MPKLQQEIKIPPRKNFVTTRKRLQQVAQLAAGRLNYLVKTALRSPKKRHLLLSLLWPVAYTLCLKRKIRREVEDTLTTQLGRVGQI